MFATRTAAEYKFSFKLLSVFGKEATPADEETATHIQFDDGKRYQVCSEQRILEYCVSRHCREATA